MTSRPAAAGTIVRLVGGGALGWWVGAAVLAPESTLLADLAALVVFSLTFWRPLGGLVAVIALAPTGPLVSRPPMHLAELLAWAFVAAWLLGVWRPLAVAPIRPRVALPAGLYVTCAFASWLGLTIGGASGVEIGALPMFLVRSMTSGHFLFTASEPETWTWLQAAAGLAVFLAGMAIVGPDARARRAVAYAIVGSVAGLAVATIVYVGSYWAGSGFEAWFLLRYVRGERFALHLADLNAAGSIYVLGMLVTLALATLDRGGRWIFAIAAVVILPALWLTGSRAASLGAVIVGAMLIPIVRYRVPARVSRGAAVALVMLAVATAGAVIAIARQTPQQGNAAHSMQLRSLFFVTSARMFASAPVFGVGIGHYHERSNEFMPPELRLVYRHENAHNYFAQQFAELGIVGGMLFVWLVAVALAQGWRVLRMEQADAAVLALFAGTAGYLLTCVTGHPLLVPEAALPFWGTFGAVAGSGMRDGDAALERRPRSEQQHGGPHQQMWRSAGALRSGSFIAVAILVVLAIGVTRHGQRYLRPAGPPPERGFYGLETGKDGRPFVWMTRHGVWHIGSQPGFLKIPVRAPDEPVRPRPFVVEVDVGGRRVGSYEIARGRWTEITVPMRVRSPRPFRRVDLWANQAWSRMRDLRSPGDDEPRSVMVGEVRWEAAGSR